VLTRMSRLPALGADQQLQRFAHRDVVVNNKTIGVACDLGDDFDWPGAVDALIYTLNSLEARH